MMIVNTLIGIATGIFSGLGIGGGSLLILYLTTFGGVNQAMAAGINLLYFISCASVALLGHIRSQTIRWSIALKCIMGGVPTAIFVSIITKGMDVDLLRRLFGIFLLIIGIHEWKSAKRPK